MTTSEPNLLRSLINAAEKAANIARLCRSNDKLLSLLIQEKTGDEANTRFEHDFKTLADVLIQETIKHDVGTEFPEIKDNIKGEESPNFTNANGESIAIAVGATLEDTEQCLLQILNTDHEEVAHILAAEVHRSMEYDKEMREELPELPNDINYSEMGIWIDPIDATAEYISGDTIFTNFPGITSTGLDCVTVLIGVYDMNTGVPVIGVVSQPFHNKVEENIYTSSLHWGIAFPNLRAHSQHLNNVVSRNGLLGIFSSSESAELLQHMLDQSYEFAFSAGAGHKALKVITSEVDIYVLTKGSTYKWDTCGPQAILRALGGDIFEFKTSVKEGKPIPLTYIEPRENTSDDAEAGAGDWQRNHHGLIAVRNLKLVDDLLPKLGES